MSINVKDITIGEGLPKVCVPIVEDNDEAILDKLKEFDQLDVDIIELRIDFYKNAREEASLPKPLPRAPSQAPQGG